MLSAALGGFTYQDTGSKLNIGINSLILTFFLFLTNIILVNLLIAILSSTYAKTIEYSNVEFSKVLHTK